MKITAIDTFTLRIPTAKPIALDLPEHRLVVTRIRTDAGLDGLGYALVFGGAGSEAVEAYARRLAVLLVGEDPTQVGRLWEKMYRADRGIRKVSVAGYALSALDIGLWDVTGKAAGLPLANLWGAVTDRVPAYGSGGWGSYSLDDLIGEAKRYTAMGCRYYKMKIHHADPLENRRRVEAVKKAVGDGVRLMVDVNQKLDVDGAIRQARVLEDLDLVWYEEPTLADDPAGCAEVARAIKIPVATGENNYTRFEFRDLIERRRRALPDARRLPRQRLHGDAAHRGAGRRRSGGALAPRRPRALGARGRRAAEHIPRRVHRLDARRSVRRAAEVRGRRLPRPRPPRPRHRAGAGCREEVPPRVSYAPA